MMMTGGSKGFYSDEFDDDCEGFSPCDKPDVNLFDMELELVDLAMPPVSQVFFGIEHPHIRHTFNERMANRREQTLIACCALATVGVICRMYNHANGIPILLPGRGWDTLYSSVFFISLASCLSLRDLPHDARVTRLAALGHYLSLPSVFLLSSVTIWCDGIEGLALGSIVATVLPLFHIIGSAVNLWIPAAGCILSWWAMIASPFSDNFKFAMCCMQGFIYVLEVLVLTLTRTRTLSDA